MGDNNQGIIGLSEKLQNQVEGKNAKLEERNQVEATLRGCVMELENILAERELRLAEAHYVNGVAITWITELEKELRERDIKSQNMEAYHKCVYDELLARIRRGNRNRMEQQVAFLTRIKNLKKKLKDKNGGNKKEESATPGKHTKSDNKDEESATPGKETNRDNKEEEFATPGKDTNSDNKGGESATPGKDIVTIKKRNLPPLAK